MNITKKDLDELLTYDKFKAYLEAQNPKESAGRCGNSLKCGIAKYLVKTLPVENMHWRVGEVINSEIPDIELIHKGFSRRFEYCSPYWVREFIRQFDNIGNKRLSYGRALKILNEIEP